MDYLYRLDYSSGQLNKTTNERNCCSNNICNKLAFKYANKQVSLAAPSTQRHNDASQGLLIIPLEGQRDLVTINGDWRGWVSHMQTENGDVDGIFEIDEHLDKCITSCEGHDTKQQLWEETKDLCIAKGPRGPQELVADQDDNRSQQGKSSTLHNRKEVHHSLEIISIRWICDKDMPWFVLVGVTSNCVWDGGRGVA